MAAALPRTESEDELMGETSDEVKAAVGQQAGKAYDAVKDQAEEVYEKTTEHASKAFEAVKADLGGESAPPAVVTARLPACSRRREGSHTKVPERMEHLPPSGI